MRQELIVGFPCAPDHGGSWGSCAYYTTGVRAESCVRADCGVPCAPDRSGARAEPYTGADAYGPPCASNHGGFEARILGKCLLWRCLISMSTRPALVTTWCSTSRVLTRTICLDLEMSWCPRFRSKSRLSTLVGQGSFVKFLRRKSWSGPRVHKRLLEHNMDFFKYHAQKRVQGRFAEVQDLVVVSEDSRFLRNALLRGWPGLMPSWHRCPWMRRRRRR